jgi:hypothetical protein
VAIDCVVPLAFSKSKAKFADVAGVDEAKQDFMEVVEFLKKQFLLFICDEAWVRHRRPTGPSPALPDFWISTDRARRGGCWAGFVTEGRPALWSPARVERARPFSGSQHGGSVAWRRSTALLQAREEEEEEDRGEKRREILIGADQDQDHFFSVATLLCFQTRSFVSSFLSLALLRKPNREAKAWRRWWWWC